MRKKVIKNMLSMAIAVGILILPSYSVLAASAHNTSTGSAGTVSVTMEVGYNGTNAYLWVSASDYVDANMTGCAMYYGVDGNRSLNLSGSFGQQTYGMVEGNCEGNIYKNVGSFSVSSADGSISRLILVAD